MARPYFTEGVAATAATRFALEDWSRARDGFVAHRKRVPATDAEGRARATLMIALCDAELGRWKGAAEGFAAAARRLPLLADWLRYQEARARYLAHDATRALALARQVPADSIVGADAELLVGDILRGRGPAAAVADHYRDYLARRADGIRRAEARFRLAEALERVPGDAARAERVALYRQIGIDDPLSAWAERGRERLAAARGQLPPDLAATIDRLSAAEHITRGKVLFDAMRNPESEAAFTAALADPAITSAEACVARFHQAQSRFKARDRTGAAPLFDAAQASCKAAGDKDLEIKSLYNAGRSYAFIKDHRTAVDRYRAAQKVDPAHSYTDDSLLREAEEWADLGDDSKVEAALASLPDRFPDGDMRAEALWRLGWRAWRKGDVAAALRWWQKQIAKVPLDDNYWAEGQPQYWIGRALARQGKAAQAVASYESAVRTYPMSYYALLALNRLRESAPERYQALVAEITAAPAGYDPAQPSFVFGPRTEWATPGFQRALELLRLGLGDPAEAELRKLDLEPPTGKTRVDDPDQIEKLWAIAFLYNRAGKKGHALWPTRWHILDYKRQWAVGANRARWEIAFPREYWELISTHATKNNVPPEMLIGIVREESGFDPLRESYANAIGLTQMIASTATRFAKGTGIAVSRETLRDPEKNVTIGSRFLGFLFAKWKGFAHLVPPSYNAGEGYVTRNLRTRGTWPADEFIEGIVDDQARNYSKRVLASYFTYAWLYGQKVPEMPNTIPPELLPK
jgi:soluble lytic murein transglycosylase